MEDELSVAAAMGRETDYGGVMGRGMGSFHIESQGVKHDPDPGWYSPWPG